jgi:hypothetical protein
MKNLLYTMILCSQVIFLATSCYGPFEQVYLRQAEVTGPIITSPLHLTDSSTTHFLTVSPKFNFNTQNLLEGNIKESIKLFERDSTFIPNERSLLWDITTFNAGLDIDYKLSKSFAIFCGVNYSFNNNFSSWGGNFGVGFFGLTNVGALRVDAGVQIHAMQYDVYSMLGKGTKGPTGLGFEYIGFFHDSGKETHIDPYLSLTYNTFFKNWPFNFFINAGYSIQTLFSFEPKSSYNTSFGEYEYTDEVGSATAGFINLTPGIYFFLGESHRVLLGTRFYIESQIEGAEPNLFILPMVQFDFVL